MRYKRGTEKVLKWLATAASRCCDISQIVASLQSSKGKQSATKGATVELRTVELPKLANAIASAKPPVEVPQDTLDLLKRVIEDRQQYAHMYATESLDAYGDITQDDKTHQHFIDVLQEIFGIIEAVSTRQRDQVKNGTISPKKARRKNQVKKTVKPANFDNSFAELSVEEPREREDDLTPPDSANKPPRIDLSKAKFKLQKQENDRKLALWCHLQDLNDVRKFVRETWLRFSRGDVSFLLASMTTEVAFALMCCADDEFGAFEPSLDSFAKILSALDLNISPSENGAVCYIVNTSKDTITHNAAIMELLCPHGVNMVDLHVANSTLMYKNFANHRAGKRKEQEPAGLCDRRQCHSLARVITNNTRSLQGSRPADKWDFDLFSAALGKAASKKERPTWIYVACEAYLELFEIIGTSGSAMGLATFQNALDEWVDRQAVHGSHREKKHYVHAPYAERLCAESNRARKALRYLRMDNAVLDRGDIYDPAFAGLSDEMNDKTSAMHSGFASGLERQFPISAGVTTYFSKITMADAGCAIANNALTVHSIAYLYLTVRHLGLLSCTWPDMDFVIASQDSTGPLVPKFGNNTSSNQLLAAFQASIDFNFTAAIRLRKRFLPELYEKGKPICIGAELSSKLLQAMRGDDKDQAKLSSSKSIQRILHQLASDRASSEGRSTTAKDARSATSRETFSPVQLLDTFTQSFMHDEHVLNFDYVGFWTECAVLASDMLHACFKGCPEMTTETTDPRIMPAMLTWSILNVLAKCPNIEKDPEFLKVSFVPDAADILEKYIKQKGKIFLQPAVDQSSGRIPKDLRHACAAGSDETKERARMQAESSKSLERAGTSVNFSDRLIALYHPQLTMDDLDEAKAAHIDRGPRDVVLPAFMIDDEMIAESGEAAPIARVWRNAVVN